MEKIDKKYSREEQKRARLCLHMGLVGSFVIVAVLRKIFFENDLMHKAFTILGSIIGILEMCMMLLSTLIKAGYDEVY